MRGATAASSAAALSAAFLLTRPLRGATAAAFQLCIHIRNFYSHAPCGARPSAIFHSSRTQLFLLTRPLRGATCCHQTRDRRTNHFYSHAPCGARRDRSSVFPGSIFISTHTPLAGRDIHVRHIVCRVRLFLLTRPLRGATHCQPLCERCLIISTHTPLAGRDTARRRTASASGISTHTPLAGRDKIIESTGIGQKNFYSHAPCGARPGLVPANLFAQLISTHTPLAGRDSYI